MCHRECFIKSIVKVRVSMEFDNTTISNMMEKAKPVHFPNKKLL